MASNEEELKQRIVQLFREKGSPSNDGNGVELPLKEIWQSLKVEKKAVNRILHHTRCFTKFKDSPPLWQYKDEQSTTTAATPSTAGTALNTSTNTEPDVVVRKKEEVTFDSPSKKEELKPGILEILRDRVPLSALQIAKSLGYTTAGDVNPTLYALKDEGKVIKEGDKWTLTSYAPNVSSLSTATQDLYLDSTPMQLDGIKLYTKEDKVQDGRQEHIFREVLLKDVLKKKSETMDDVDVSKETGLASTQPAPQDDVILGVLSSLYDDHNNEFDLALQIVNILKASGDTPLDDADIYMKLNFSTRLETRPVLDNLETYGLVEKIHGDVVKWKWKIIT